MRNKESNSNINILYYDAKTPESRTCHFLGLDHKPVQTISNIRTSF